MEKSFKNARFGCRSSPIHIPQNTVLMDSFNTPFYLQKSNTDRKLGIELILSIAIFSFNSFKLSMRSNGKKVWVILARQIIPAHICSRSSTVLLDTKRSSIPISHIPEICQQRIPANAPIQPARMSLRETVRGGNQP